MKNTGTLAVSLPADTDILLTRVFDAPAHLVWRALNEPELMKQWYGPHGHVMTVCENDLRVGGSYRHVSRGPDGREVAFRGTYSEIEPGRRIVCTEELEAMPGSACLVTITLEETGGKTTFRLLGRYPTKQIRDFVLATGMEHGAAESYDRLAALLPALRGG